MVHLNRSINLSAILTGVALSPLFAAPLSFFNHFEQNNRYVIALKYHNANDAISIKDEARYSWNKEGYSPREGTNLALINHRMDVGINIHDWYFGYALRYDMFIQTNRSTTDILQLINTKSNLPLDRLYEVNLKAYGIATHNLLLSRSFTIHKNFKAFASVAWIQAFGMQEGFVDAYANIVSRNEYDFEGYSEYYYDKNHLYTLDVEKPKGYGYSLQFGLEYQHRAHIFRFLAQDFASKIYWKDLPYSEVSIISDKKEYDEKGYVTYKPSISGYELYRNYTQTLEAKYQLEYEYQYNTKLSGKVALGYYRNYLLPFAALKYKQNHNISYLVGYEGRFKQLSLGMEWYDFKLSIAANNITHPTALSLDLRYSF
jgi:hypothetical protein